MTAPRWEFHEPTDEELRASNDEALQTPLDPSIVCATYGRTDYGNAQRLALYEARNLRYVNDSDSWYKWCETNWCEATLGDKFALAAQTALRIGQEEIRHIDDADERGQHTRWAQHSLGEGALRAMVTVASGIDSLRVDASALDARTHLLNFPNCTLDPLTLEAHDHDRDDLLTQLCPTEYVPDARSGLLDQFLERFIPDEKERDYLLQVVAVSSLSYGNAARKIILLLGPTSTGKSTLMELLMKTLGRDYSAAVNPSVFRGSLDDKPRPDLLRALKTRVILAFEASERWELHTDQIKRMTGGDALTARGMRSNVMNETIASFVPIIVANLPPAIHGSDDALRRRLLALVMDVSVNEDEDDGLLRSKLVNDSDAQRALVAKLVRIYHDCGGKVTLTMPSRFAEKTMELFASLDDVDEILRWLKEDGTIVPLPENLAQSRCIQTSELFKCYSAWIDQYGTHQMKRDRLGAKQFTQRLQSLGYEIHRVNGSRVRGWCMGDTRMANVARF